MTSTLQITGDTFFDLKKKKKTYIFNVHVENKINRGERGQSRPRCADAILIHSPETYIYTFSFFRHTRDIRYETRYYKLNYSIQPGIFNSSILHSPPVIYPLSPSLPFFSSPLKWRRRRRSLVVHVFDELSTRSIGKSAIHTTFYRTIDTPRSSIYLGFSRLSGT